MPKEFSKKIAPNRIWGAGSNQDIASLCLNNRQPAQTRVRAHSSVALTQMKQQNRSNKTNANGQPEVGRRGPKSPLPARVAVFPDIGLKSEHCWEWTRRTFGHRMPPGIGWDDLFQETLREILEEEQAHTELDQIRGTPATARALQTIFQCGDELPDALATVLKVCDTPAALIDLLEQPEAQRKLRMALDVTDARSDAPSLEISSPELRDLLIDNKGHHALLTILGCQRAQVAVLTVLRQYPLPPVLRRILRWWPAFSLDKAHAPTPLVPFEAAFKQTCWGRWADACRRHYRVTPAGKMAEPASVEDHADEVSEDTDSHRRSRRDEALQALKPHERLVVCLSYLCDDFATMEIGQILGLAKLGIQAQLSSDAFSLASKGRALGGNLRLLFFSDELSRSGIKRVLGLAEICIPLSFLRASLSEGEAEAALAGRIQLRFFRDDLTAEEVGQMLGLPSLRVLRCRALKKMRRFFPELR